MKEKKFTLIELFMVMAIIAILAGMFVPIVMEVKRKHYYEKTGWKAKGMSYEVFRIIARSSDGLKDGKLKQITLGQFKLLCSDGVISYSDVEMYLANLKGCGYFGALPSVDVLTDQSDTYDNWMKFTGNPKQFTRQQFETLYKADKIQEYQYDTYKHQTGNPQDLSEEEFNVLKKAKQIRLYRKDAKPAGDWE